MAEIALENAPRKARELFDKGFAAMERGNLDYAMDMFTASLDIEPRLLHARKFLRAAAIKKFKDKGGGQAAHMISSLTGFPGILKVSATMKKKPLEALKAAEKLMRVDPLNMQFVNTLGKAAVAAGMPEVAIQTFEIAKDHYPDNVELLRQLATLYTEANRMRDARMCYEEVARVRPTDPKAIKQLKDASAMDTIQKGGWNEANSYRDMMKDSKEATLLEQQAKAVKSGSDLDALIHEIEGKVQREPDNVNHRRSLADFYARALRFEDAIRTLSEVQEGAGRSDPQVDRTLSAIRAKQFDHNIAELEAKSDKAGAAAMTKQKDDFMVADAADRVQRYPNDLQFRYEYGVLLFEHGQLNEAIQQFQQSQRNPQRRIRSLYFLAQSFEQKKQYDIAMEQLEKAASELHIMDETKKDIFYEMGLVYELMGNPQKAAQYFKEIYSVDIQYRDVAQKIEKAYS